MDCFSQEYLDDLLLRFMRTPRYRTYDLVMINGEPQFVRSEFDQIFQDALDAAYGKRDEDER